MLWSSVGLCLVGFVVCSPAVTKTRKDIEAFRDALEKSRTEDGVRLDSRMLANPKANFWENSGKYEGDIILDNEQIEALVASYAGTRTAYTIPNTRWPGNVMLYEFGDNEFDAAQQEAILRNMAWVEHFSCVRFRRRLPHEQDFVLMTGSPDGCYAHVGFQDNLGVHTFNLARADPGKGCFNNVIIIHELLHSLGFFHMQSAYERYNYVRINWNNIATGMAHNFYRYGRNQVSLLSLPYEYQSSMHYSTHAFSINGETTIEATKSFPGVMGHMNYVTYLDWVRLRRHYNCSGAWNEKEMQTLKEEVERTIPMMQGNLPPPPKTKKTD